MRDCARPILVACWRLRARFAPVPAAVRDDAADRGADPRPVRHEPRSDGRLHAADLVRPCRRLRIGRLHVAAICCCTPACRCCSPSPLAALFSGVVAIGVAWVCTLASGVSFSMLTLAFAQLLYAVAFKWTSVTGASDGLAGIPRSPGPFGITVFSGKAGFYYLVLACLLGALRVLPRRWCARRSARCCAASARTRRRRLSLGYNTRRYKIAVVAIAFALGGLAGALYAPFAGFANTELLFWLFSGQVLIMVIVGGAGTLVGPIIGAAFFMLVSNCSVPGPIPGRCSSA